ncbi:MAG: DUF192 domain-containing protein [Elusimicrobiota bacterium]
MIAYNATRGVPIAVNVTRADNPASRSRGLIGRRDMDGDEGLWIDPCPMIHTFFMSFPIDVLFLDADLRVRRVMEDLRPWRVSPWVWSARSVLELKGGSLKGSVRVGDSLEMRTA